MGAVVPSTWVDGFVQVRVRIRAATFECTLGLCCAVAARESALVHTFSSLAKGHAQQRIDESLEKRLQYNTVKHLHLHRKPVDEQRRDQILDQEASHRDA